MDILVPKGFAIDSIEKCMMDYDCNFIEYDDEEAISSRLGSSFIVLKESYFIAHYPHQQVNQKVKCDYNCRSRIMMTLLSEYAWLQENYCLEKADNVLRNKNPPYLLFTNECIRGFFQVDEDSIIANYTTVNILSFVEITKSKQCNHSFFMVNLGDDRHLCCDIQTLETYEYHSSNRPLVLDILSGRFGEPFTVLKSEYEMLKTRTPPPRLPTFTLTDIEGNPVEENTEYQLEMFDRDMDILRFCDDKLSATACDNLVKPVVVKYSIVAGIHYLTYENKYLHVADGSAQISLTDKLPSKHQRLYFAFTEENENAFVIFNWNQFVYLNFETFKHSYSHLVFNEEAAYTYTGDILTLFLKRV
ncbi:unnamed protein product [Umbelopsis ramanniana]